MGQSHDELVSQILNTNMMLRYTRREQFAHLKGFGIKMSAASRKYPLATRGRLNLWLKRGWLKVIDDSQPRLLDEADVAFLHRLQELREPLDLRGPLLTDSGEPDVVHYPDTAARSRYNPKTKKSSK